MKRHLSVALLILPVALTRPCPANGQGFDPSPWLGDLSAARQAITTKYAGLAWDVDQRDLSLDDEYRRVRERVSAAQDADDARHAFDAFAQAFGDRHVHFEWPRPRPEQARGPRSVCPRLGYDTRMQASPLALRMSGVESLSTSPKEFATGTLKIAKYRFGIIKIALFSPQGFPAICEDALAALQIRADAGCDQRCEDTIEHWAYERYTKDFETALRSLKTAGAEVLLVDIAGNGGGSEWVEAAARMVTTTPLKPLRTRFVKGEHWRKRFELKVQALTEAARAAPSDRELLLRVAEQVRARQREAAAPCDGEAIAKREATCEWTGDAFFSTGILETLSPAARSKNWAPLVFTPAQYPYADGVWSGPVVVLVDGGTGSAAEQFAAELQDNHAATIIGSATVGAGCGYTDGGTPTTLPNSHAVLRVSDCVRMRLDGTSLVNGVQPDILIGFRDRDPERMRARMLLETMTAKSFQLASGVKPR